MTAYVALLRAVNVGGRKLLMSDLKAIADDLGLANARTFIASGNLLFTSDLSETELKVRLEQRLKQHMGQPVPVLIRTAEELAHIAVANPFPDEPANYTVAVFLDEPPAADALAAAKNVTVERMELGRREIYIAYGSGMGRSKLRVPAAAHGTARNMNTVVKLAQLAGALA